MNKVRALGLAGVIALGAGGAAACHETNANNLCYENRGDNEGVRVAFYLDDDRVFCSMFQLDNPTNGRCFTIKVSNHWREATGCGGT